MSNKPSVVIPRRTALGGGPFPAYLEPGELYTVLGAEGAALLLGDAKGNPDVLMATGVHVDDSGNVNAYLNGTGTILFNNPAPVTISLFFDVTYPFQTFTVQSRNSNTTIAHNARIKLKGAADLLVTPDMALMFQADETPWVIKQI
jgi:hypothetical protein